MSEWRTESAKRILAAPSWARWLSVLRRLCADSESGQPRGHVELPDVTEAERDILDGFLGTYTPRNKAPRLPIRHFETQLRELGLAPSLLALFEALDGTPLRTRGWSRDQQAEGWEAVFRQVRLRAAGLLLPETESWFASLQRKEGRGARTLQRIYGDNADRAVQALLQVLQAIHDLLARKRNGAAATVRDPILPLPVLAARVTGDAHGLDWAEPVGGCSSMGWRACLAVRRNCRCWIWKSQSQ